MLGKPGQTDKNTSICQAMSPGCFEPKLLSGCSTFVSVDLIQLCCCDAVSCTWIRLLLSLDWYQHRGVLVLH